MSIFHPKISDGQLKKFHEPPFVSDSSHSQEQERVFLGLLRFPFKVKFSLGFSSSGDKIISVPICQNW